MKITTKNIFKIFATMFLVYLPAILLVLFTDFEDKNRYVSTYIIVTTISAVYSLIRYFKKERMENNHHKDVI